MRSPIPDEAWWRDDPPWLDRYCGRPSDHDRVAGWEPVVALLRVAAQTEERLGRALDGAGFSGLSAEDGASLVFLAHRPYARAVQLARHLGVTRQRASTRCRRLAETGYLVRQPLRRIDGPVAETVWRAVGMKALYDGRARALVLTPRGHEAAAVCVRAATAELAAWATASSPQRAASLRRNLLTVARPGGIRPAVGGPAGPGAPANGGVSGPSVR